jgi:hypothetical protein
MNKLSSSEIKNLILSSLNEQADSSEVSSKIEEAGVSYDFKEGFGERILGKIFTAGAVITKEVDFVRSFNLSLYPYFLWKDRFLSTHFSD